ncbi:hypothetical protein VTO42DRAFT_1379 [Malbranchea cinnamomea]
MHLESSSERLTSHSTIFAAIDDQNDARSFSPSTFLFYGVGKPFYIAVVLTFNQVRRWMLDETSQTLELLKNTGFTSDRKGFLTRFQGRQTENSKCRPIVPFPRLGWL